MKYNIKMKLLSIPLFSSLLILGCSKPSINMNTKPVIQIPKKQIQAKRKKGALYSRKGASLFADKKDLQIGDILQVVVQETLKNDSKGSRAIKTDTTTSLGGGVASPATGVTLTEGGQKRVDKFNANFGVKFAATTANSFAGSSASKVDEKFSTTISVIIEQTYQNGNYFVHGSKEMLIDGQKQPLR